MRRKASTTARRAALHAACKTPRARRFPFLHGDHPASTASGRYAPSAAPRSTRGETPNFREYSRLNWFGLS